MLPDTTDPKLSRAARTVGLPPRLFLYSLEQVAYCVDISVAELRRKYIHFDGRSARAVPLRGMLLARNVSPDPSVPPEWRVSERELVRWMRHKGFRFIESTQMIR